MILVDTPGAGPGAGNMEADVRSAMDCVAGRQTPHLRLYRWNPAAISLGVHQDPSIIDEAVARLHGVDVVRRPTGGGAILHTDELTYCLTLPLGHRSPTELYGLVTDALLMGLRFLNVQADAEVWPSPSSPEGYFAEPMCFSGIARHEIRVGGRKLIGSAQRVYRTADGDPVVLQHGSILMSDAHALLPVYLRGRVFGVTSRRVEALRARSTSLREVLPTAPDDDAILRAFRGGFEATSALWEARDIVEQVNPQEVNT